MRKATGKVVSLVLALALVITSFSATFASAASTKTESAASVTAYDDTMKLVNLSNVDDVETAKTGNLDKVNLSEFLLEGEEGVTLETYDHIKINSGIEISSISVSGDSIIRVTKVTEANKDDYSDFATVGEYVATVRSTTGTGTAKLNVLYTGTTTERNTDEEITVRGSKSFTVELLDAKTPYLTSVDNLQKNPQVAGSGSNTYVTYNTEDGKYAANSKPVVTDTASFALPVRDENSALKNGDDEVKVVAYNKDGGYTAGSLDLGKDEEFYAIYVNGTNSWSKIADNNEGFTFGVASPAVGNTVRISVYSVKEDANGSTYSNNKVVAQATSKVENKVAGAISSVELGDGTDNVTINMKSDSILSKSKTYVKIGNEYWDVTGAEVVTSSNVVVESGRIGNLTATDGDETGDPTVKVNDGTVGDIEADGAVQVYGGSVGDIDTNGNVDINNATVASISDADVVTIDDGTISGSVSADEVSVIPASDEVSVSVGAVSAAKLTIDTTNGGKATVASFFAAEGVDGYALTLAGDLVTLGAINADYRKLTISLNNFQGIISAPTKANSTGYDETGAKLTTGDLDTMDATKATVSGALSIETIELESGAVTFNDSVNVDLLYGSEADFIINAGDLYVAQNISTSNTLKIADAADVKAGTLVFRAASDIADVDSFVTYGYDLKLVSSSSYDGFVIDGVEFAGLTLDVGSSLELVVGETAVVTASAYPNGTQLPENTKIEFYLNDADLNYLEGKNLGNNQASVTALAYDEEFSVLNKGTLVAVVLDEYDIQLEEYGEATCDITIVETKAPTETYKSDTTDDVVVAKGNTYQFKITSLNGQAPSVVLGSDGVFELVGTSQNGNDYFFKFQAVGAAGSATGVYVNGDAKVATMYVDGNTGYTCDTTTVNVPAGGTYQVKITAASMPTLLPGNSIYTVAFASQEGNDYFFKITATSAQAGDVVGFYINGGARAFVATTV